MSADVESARHQGPGPAHESPVSWRRFIAAPQADWTLLAEVVARASGAAAAVIVAWEMSGGQDRARRVAAFPEALMQGEAPLWLLTVVGDFPGVGVERRRVSERTIAVVASLPGSSTAMTLVVLEGPGGATPLIAEAAARLAMAACETRLAGATRADLDERARMLEAVGAVCAAMEGASSKEAMRVSLEAGLAEVLGQEVEVRLHTPEEPVAGVDVVVRAGEAAMVSVEGREALAAPLWVTPARPGERAPMRNALVVIPRQALDDERVTDRIVLMAELCAGTINRMQWRERGWGTKAGAAARDLGAWALAPRHAAWKFGVVLLLAAAVTAATVRVEERVTARAVVEAVDARLVTAARGGVLRGVSAHVGDVVAEGDAMGRLETSELELERAEIGARLVGLERETESARARGEVTQAAALADESEAARRRLELVELALDRSVVRAPRDGVVAQAPEETRLGAVVEAGEALFRVMPQGRVRVRMFAAPGDIGSVARGAQAAFAANATPEAWHAGEVREVIGVARDGRFEVVIALGDAEALAPGVEGVARVDVRRASLLSVWGRRLWRAGREAVSR